MFDPRYAIVPMAFMLASHSAYLGGATSQYLSAAAEAVAPPKWDCTVRGTDPWLQDCTIRVFQTRVYTVRYSYYAARENHGRASKITVYTSVGRPSELPNLRKCAAVETHIDNASVARAECNFEMYYGPEFAFTVRVDSHNTKDEAPKPGLEIL